MARPGSLGTLTQLKTVLDLQELRHDYTNTLYDRVDELQAIWDPDNAYYPVVEGLIATGALTAIALGAGSVTSAELASNAVVTTSILNGAVTSAKLASNAVVNTSITNGTVDSTKLAASAVVATSILDGVISGAKLASGIVDSTKLAANAVVATSILNGAVGSTKLASNAVIPGVIAGVTVTGTVETAGTAQVFAHALGAMPTMFFIMAASNGAAMIEGVDSTSITVDVATSGCAFTAYVL